MTGIGNISWGEEKSFIKINESYANVERIEVVSVRAVAELICSFPTLEIISVTMAKSVVQLIMWKYIPQHIPTDFCGPAVPQPIHLLDSDLV